MWKPSHWFSYVLMLMAIAPPEAHAQNIATTAGGVLPNNVAASGASVGFPTAVALDGTGRLYVVSESQHAVFRVSTPIPTGTRTVAASGPGMSAMPRRR